MITSIFFITKIFDELSADGLTKFGNFIWLQLIFGPKILLFRTQPACYAKRKYSLAKLHGEWWVRLSERLSMYFVVKNPCVPPQMHMRKYRNAVHDNWGNSTCGVSNLWVWHHCKIAIVPSMSLLNNFNHQVYPSGLPVQTSNCIKYR